jgi:fatty-acyl-CoA synthase
MAWDSNLDPQSPAYQIAADNARYIRVLAGPGTGKLPSLLDELAARFPAREALVGCGQRHTYAALREEVRAFAKGLYALGVRTGEMVAILMGNKPEWVIADLAICSLGGIMVAVNTWVTTRELGYVLAHSDATTRCSTTSSR